MTVGGRQEATGVLQGYPAYSIPGSRAQWPHGGQKPKALEGVLLLCWRTVILDSKGWDTSLGLQGARLRACKGETRGQGAQNLQGQDWRWGLRYCGPGTVDPRWRNPARTKWARARVPQPRQGPYTQIPLPSAGTIPV